MFVISSVAVLGCRDSPSTLESETENSARTLGSWVFRPTKAELDELEQSVLTEGHQPWRLVPRMVAQSALWNVVESKIPKRMPQKELAQIDEDANWRVDIQRTSAVAKWTGIRFHAVVDLKNTRESPEFGWAGVWFAEKVVIGLR